MMDRLEIPLQLAGQRVYGNERRAKEIRSFAIASPIIRGWLAERHIQDAALRIDRQKSPDVRTRPVFPGIALPGIATGLARSRDRMKRPDEFSGAHIPGPRIAGRADARSLLDKRPRNDQVFVNNGRR